MDHLALRIKLNRYFDEVKFVIVDKQNPITGLLPASTAVNSHGDYRDAWVRDNVYSILAVWGLGIAYRALDDDDGRGQQLQDRTVHLMRGLLRSMMAQSEKVEAFKKSRDPKDALHAKYDTETGGTVVGDDAWGHLQTDATSVFLLMLVQMTASGLRIIWTDEEVNFIQNLVYYIERAYRVPDFGIWERGAKSNHGRVELNASSLGMAKAALEALAGFNLLGSHGSPRSVIHVSPDNIAQADITLRAMLPRESHTKEVDAAVLSVVGFPAFAVHDRGLRKRTLREIKSKLEGKYGLKRFLRDGHQTAVENEGRLHYEAEELKRFEHIESEWPLFFVYLLLDAQLSGDHAEADRYATLLQGLTIERDGQELLPELYYVPEGSIEQERAAPGSSTRLPNANVPLVWAQSLYLVAKMLRDGVLLPGDIDPLGRRRHKKSAPPVIQLLLLAEDAELQGELVAHGLRTETLEDIAPVEVYLPEDVAEAHSQVGRCKALGLTGRSNRALKSLTTSRIYQLEGKTAVCLAPFFLQQEFYLAYDMGFLVSRFRSELAYLRRHFTLPGRPTVAILLTRDLLSTDRSPLFALMQEINQGRVGEVPVRLGTLAELLPTASFERLDGLIAGAIPSSTVARVLKRPRALSSTGKSTPLTPEEERSIEGDKDTGALLARLSGTNNLYEQIEVLDALVARFGLNHLVELDGVEVTLGGLASEVYEQAGRSRLWGVVRHAAGLLHKVDVDLNLACAALLVAHKHIQVGRAYSPESLIAEPLPDEELLQRIERFCREDVRDRALTQEVLLYLGILVRARPELFFELVTVRVSHLIGLLTGKLARELSLAVEDAYEQLLHLPPLSLKAELEGVLERYSEMESLPQQLEQLSSKGDPGRLSWHEDLGLSKLQEPKEGWLSWRQHHGIIDRRPDDFYARTWEIFRHVPCLLIGDKLDRKSRIESGIVLSDMTPGEKSFAMLIEHLLNNIAAPEYRQLTIETLTALASFFEQNEALQVTDALYVDAVIGHAVRLLYLGRSPERAARYSDDKAEAWSSFYAASPEETSNALVEALRHLLGAKR